MRIGCSCFREQERRWRIPAVGWLARRVPWRNSWDVGRRCAWSIWRWFPYPFPIRTCDPSSPGTIWCLCSWWWFLHFTIRNEFRVINNYRVDIVMEETVPLWTTMNSLLSSERCGWELTSLGTPWVAHRVCDMPTCDLWIASNSKLLSTSHTEIQKIETQFNRTCKGLFGILLRKENGKESPKESQRIVKVAQK